MLLSGNKLAEYPRRHAYNPYIECTANGRSGIQASC